MNKYFFPDIGTVVCAGQSAGFSRIDHVWYIHDWGWPDSRPISSRSRGKMWHPGKQFRRRNVLQERQREVPTALQRWRWTRIDYWRSRVAYRSIVTRTWGMINSLACFIRFSDHQVQSTTETLSRTIFDWYWMSGCGRKAKYGSNHMFMTRQLANVRSCPELRRKDWF